MKRLAVTPFILLGLFVVSFAATTVTTDAVADDDHEQARRLKESGQILSLEQILKAAQSVHSGRVLEVELDNEKGRYVYEVELLDERGEVWELYFDAANGKLIKRERED